MKVQPIKLYVIVLGGWAVGAFFILDWHNFSLLPTSALLGLLCLTILGIVSEGFAFSTKLNQQASNASLTFLPLVAAVALFGQVAAVLFITVTGTVAEILIRRKQWEKTAFNISQYIVSTSVAGWVFYALGGAPIAVPPVASSIDAALILPLAAFGFTALLLNHLAVTVAVSLTSRSPLWELIGSAFSRVGGTVLYDLLVLPVAILVAILYQTLGIFGLIISFLPLIFIRYAYLSKYRLELANRDLLQALVKAIETRDPYTSGHARRVQDLALRIGAELRLSRRHLEELGQAALLHDIGKIEVVYEQILMKPSHLTLEERRIIEGHVMRGVEILTSLSSFSKRVIDGVRHHHESWDGSGYPDGLAGETIPLCGRLIQLSDAVDAMLSDRPYRKALTLEQVRSELVKGRGVQFDPQIVNVVIDSRLLEEHEAQMEIEHSLRPRKPAVQRRAV